jgi:hypothetical protein
MEKSGSDIMYSPVEPPRTREFFRLAAGRNHRMAVEAEVRV